MPRGVANGPPIGARGVPPIVPPSPDRRDPQLKEEHDGRIRGTATRSLLRVIYEGRDPVTGKEKQRWAPAGSDRVEAERLAARLAAKEQGRVDAVRGLTVGAYITSHWLPANNPVAGLARATHHSPTLLRERVSQFVERPSTGAVAEKLLVMATPNMLIIITDEERYPPPYETADVATFRREQLLTPRPSVRTAAV